jgi:hypothetical protein
MPVNSQKRKNEEMPVQAYYQNESSPLSREHVGVEASNVHIA